jgi:hypothetical protein
MHPPTFAEYPVLAEFQGPPAPLNIASHSLARQFRTMLRKGATEGPNFADHYTIMLAPWLCGERAVDLGCAAKADLAGPHKIRFEVCVDHTSVR